jgi:hypothetical protein
MAGCPAGQDSPNTLVCRRNRRRKRNDNKALFNAQRGIEKEVYKVASVENDRQVTRIDPVNRPKKDCTEKCDLHRCRYFVIAATCVLRYTARLA